MRNRCSRASSSSATGASGRTRRGPGSSSRTARSWTASFRPKLVGSGCGSVTDRRSRRAPVAPDRLNVWDWNRGNDSIVLGQGKGAADTAGGRAVVKYFAKATYLIGLFLQAAWVFA